MVNRKYPPPVRPHNDRSRDLAVVGDRAGAVAQPPIHSHAWPDPHQQAAPPPQIARPGHDPRIPGLTSGNARLRPAPTLRSGHPEGSGPGGTNRAAGHPGPRPDAIAIQERRPATKILSEPRPTGPRFDPGPFPAERPAEAPARPRRALQASLLLGLVAITATLVVTVPNAGEGDNRAETTTRVEADRPTATAELLASDRNLDVSGTLADVGALGRPDESFFEQPDPAGSLDISYRHLNGVVEPVIGATTTGGADAGSSTTAWVEPTLPPESDWVDTGNGVMVPDLQLRIRFCESTNNYKAANPSSSARGAYQFLEKSWKYYGFAARFGAAEAHLATPAQQDQAALETLQSQGTTPWRASRECWSDPDIDPRYATAKRAPRPAPTPAPTTATTVDDGSSTTDTAGESTSTTVDGSTTTVDPGSSTTTTPESTTTTAPTTPST